MHKTAVARILTRLDDENDGLFLGVVKKNGRPLFRPNYIYELQYDKFSEEIVLKPVGPSNVASLSKGETFKDSLISLTTGHSANEILETGPYCFLTKNELQQVHEAEQQKINNEE